MAPERDRPAGAPHSDEPKSRSTPKSYESRPQATSPSGQDLKRAERLVSYWNEFRKLKRWDGKAKPWIVAMVCDDDIHKAAAKLGEALQLYLDPHTGEMEVGHKALAGDLSRDEKTVWTIIHSMQDAGYLNYAPGRKGVGYSRFTMTVPEVGCIEDVVSRKKIPGCEASTGSKKIGPSTASARKKSPAERRDSREKIPGTIYNNKQPKSDVGNRTSEMSKGEVSLQGNPPPTNSGYIFIERPGSEFAKRRDAPDARSASDFSRLGNVEDHLRRLRAFFQSGPAMDRPDEMQALLRTVPSASEIATVQRERELSPFQDLDDQGQLLHSLHVLVSDLEGMQES